MERQLGSGDEPPSRPATDLADHLRAPLAHQGRAAFAVEQIDAPGAMRYRDLTYPGYRPLLARMAEHNGVFAVGGTRFGRPIGLALATLAEDGVAGALLSVFVRPGYRGIGVGTALLLALEGLLTQSGCQQVSLTYPTGGAETAPLESLLRRCGWEPTEPRPESGLPAAGHDLRAATKTLQAKDSSRSSA